jgi:hypothetical protein
VKNGVIGIRMKLHIFRPAAQGSGHSGLDGYGHLQSLLSKRLTSRLLEEPWAVVQRKKVVQLRS